MTPDAVRRWSDELVRDPASLAFIRLAEALRQGGRLDDARAVVLRGLERHPHVADAHDVLARIHTDTGDLERAGDEWEIALRLEPGHAASLKGLGFLAYRRNDLAAAEKRLREALACDTGDEGVATALRHVRQTLRAANQGPPTRGEPNGRRGEYRPSSGAKARELFAPMLGDGDRTALLIDRDGLVLAGAYVNVRGRDVGDEIGAELSGVGDEAARALDQLGLGDWSALLVEAQHATVALAPANDGAIVLVAAARDTQVGFVRRLLTQARAHAIEWLGATP
jgi:predicted regulator of Ras-like GTPase activity (Roadblock/LC7/MglB family)